MQLKNLFTPIEELSDEELKQRLQEIRHNRTVTRPAAGNRAKREANKGKTARVNKAQSLLAGMSPDQIKQLLMEFDNND